MPSFVLIESLQKNPTTPLELHLHYLVKHYYNNCCCMVGKFLWNFMPHNTEYNPRKFFKNVLANLDGKS
jgi:hypothetical protein